MTAVLRRVIGARIHGAAQVPLSLEYRTVDPVGIEITLGNCCHRRSWHVAREVIREGLAVDPFAAYADESAGAAAVLVSRLRVTDVALVVLRGGGVRLPVTVPTAELEQFLAATYQACPSEREALCVAEQLDKQCRAFYLTQGGNPV